MKVLVTGVNGFVGGHLTEKLKDDGHVVFGCGLQKTPSVLVGNLITEYFHTDLTVESEVRKLPLSDMDAVVHLAGLAAVGASFEQPHEYLRVNEGSVLELFEAAHYQNAKSRFLIVSSGAVYSGKHEKRDESTPTEVSSPYVASKLSSETWTEYYRQRGFDAIIARPFNHAGPRQEKGFIVPDIASQIAGAKNNPNYVIKVGNVATERDYTDVRDVVRAYALLIGAPVLNHTIYNICSGTSVSGQVILDSLRNLAGKPDMDFEAEVTQLRPKDVPKIVGSYDRIKEDTEWEPKIPLTETLKDTLADWVARN